MNNEENLNENECNNEEYELPYCKVCHSCGEDGCCSALNCAYKMMVSEDSNLACDYGGGYYKDLKIAYLIADECGKLIEKLRRGEITDIEYFVELYDGKVKEICEEVYGK